MMGNRFPRGAQRKGQARAGVGSSVSQLATGLLRYSCRQSSAWCSPGVEPPEVATSTNRQTICGCRAATLYRNDAAHRLRGQVAGSSERRHDEGDEIVEPTDQAIVRLISEPWPTQRNLLPIRRQPPCHRRPEPRVTDGARQKHEPGERSAPRRSRLSRGRRAPRISSPLARSVRRRRPGWAPGRRLAGAWPAPWRPADLRRRGGGGPFAPRAARP
jgi:hypothetical protein